MNAIPVLMLVLVAPLLAPRAVLGQARPPASSGAEGASAMQSETNPGGESGQPGLDREVFAYPGGERRDPFERPLPGNSARTGFDDLRLIGVIHSPNGRESVALVSSRTAAAAARGERTFRLRQDVVLGDMRVLRVEREYVIVEIRRFGIAEQRELRLDRASGRAGQ